MRLAEPLRSSLRPTTDVIDAKLLAHFADWVRPSLRELPDEATQALGALLARRRQLVEMLTSERNRLGSAPRTVPGSTSHGCGPASPKGTVS